MSMNYNFRITSVVLIALFGIVFSVSAHGVGGTYESIQGEYFIDIGYTPEFPIDGTRVRFDYNLYQAISTSTNVMFTDVWARIEKNDVTYFSGSVHQPSIGPTGFSYLFTEPGLYKISARFQSDLDVVVDDSFFLNVATSTPSQSDKRPKALLITVLVSMLGLSFLVLLGLVYRAVQMKKN